MDQKVVGGIFVALVCFGFFYFVINQDTNISQVEVNTLEEKTDLYEIHAEFPTFSQADRDFNEKIKKTVLDSIESFKLNLVAQDNIKSASTSEAPFTYASSWTPDQVNKKVISFVQNTSFYTGGAHGSRELYTFTYDIEKEKEIFLEDVFKGASRYLDRISQYAVNDLQSQLATQAGVEPNIEMIRSGTSPVQKNYSKFTLNPNGMITFYFDEYQVAPFAAGEQKIVMPISFILTQKNND